MTRSALKAAGSSDALALAREARARGPLVILAASALDAERLREEIAWFDAGLRVHRLPDREARAEEFFLKPAAALPDRRFLIGGNGWDSKPMPTNVRAIGHVGTETRNKPSGFNTRLTSSIAAVRSLVERCSRTSSATTQSKACALKGSCLIGQTTARVPKSSSPSITRSVVMTIRSGRDRAK